MLIGTLPLVTQMGKVYQMFQHPLIGGARYNIGQQSPYSPEETLTRILVEVDRSKKRFWVDLKGRQLRITQWADPTYSDIVLNHSISVDLPARIVFRDKTESSVVAVNGNHIFVDPPPEKAVGKGQAVNILGTNLKIDGYLIEDDKEYIAAAKKLGIKGFMLSFVEEESDLLSVLSIYPEAELVLKIESQKGLEFVSALNLKKWPTVHLMTARDDLMVNIGGNKANILKAEKDILSKDDEAIVASHILTSLDKGAVSAADISDLAYLTNLGYRNFMLSDTVSHKYFDEAMKVWQGFQSSIRK